MALQSILPRTHIFLLAVCLVTAAIGCGRSIPPAVVASPQQADEVSATATPNPFLEVARKIENSHNRYLGRQQIQETQRKLDQADDHQERVNLQLQLCWHHLRLGNMEQADSAIKQAFAEVQSASGRVPAPMLKLRALVHMREAELRNCIARHNSECCVFPLAGGGIHSEREPMATAREFLLAMLEADPRSLEAAWLLNLTSMATGDYPNDIPEFIRLPRSALDSEQKVRRFVDVAGKLGVDTFNLCGGAIVEDFTGDGLLDIVTSTYDPRGHLTFYQNHGDGTFTDKSTSAGTTDQLGGLNCIAVDYDNDGDQDILVLRGAWLEDDGKIRNSLLQNDGNGHFVDVSTAAGVATPESPTQAAVWADFDNDGWLDLFIGNESRAELSDDGTGNFPSQLFHNQGDGTFKDVANSAGVTNDRYCKGVAAGDYDNDGDIDVYVSNRGPNRLYRNNGDLTFTDVAVETGVMEPVQQSFASWFFDYDNDGHLDLFVAAYQATNEDVAAGYFELPHRGVAPCLYRNLGNGQFEDVAQQVGLDRAYLPMGANFGDIDNDGFLDIYLTTGRPDFAALMPNVMFRNDGAQQFVDVTFAGGFGHLQKGHGIAFADIDNDGDQDIYHQLGGFFPSDKFHNALFANPGNENHFIVVRLRGKTTNRNAIGAKIRVIANGPGGQREIHRTVGAVSSFGGSPFRQEIGIGSATSIEQIDIVWPTPRSAQTLENVPIDSFISVEQGGEWKREDLPTFSLLN